MRRFLPVFIILTVFSCVSPAQPPDGNFANDEVTRFREIRERQFRNRAVSPLRQADFLTFEKLNYYPISEKLRFRAFFEPTPDEKAFMMPTSTGKAQKYRKTGILRFSLDGRDFTLGAFQRVFEQAVSTGKQNFIDLFIPFKDLTNGLETYGAGRYVYVRLPKDSDEVILDFNLTHNPSCAYGDENFSCALPPKENFLPAEIRAGEKIYKNYGVKHE